jgi:hypothetical protein
MTIQAINASLLVRNPSETLQGRRAADDAATERHATDFSARVPQSNRRVVRSRRTDGCLHGSAAREVRQLHQPASGASLTPRLGAFMPLRLPDGWSQVRVSCSSPAAP